MERNLREELERKNMEVIALREVSKAVSSTLELSELLDLSVDILLEMMQVDKGFLMMLDEEGVKFNVVSSKGFVTAIDSIDFKRDDASIVWITSFGLPISAASMRSDSRYSQLSEVEIEKLEAIETEVFIPVKAKGGVTGIFCLGEKRSQEEYTFEDLELLHTLVSLIASSIHNAQLYEDIEVTSKKLDKKVFDLYALNELARLMSSTLNTDELAALITDMFIEMMRVREGMILLNDDSSGRLIVGSSKGYVGSELGDFYLDVDVLSRALGKDLGFVLTTDRDVMEEFAPEDRSRLADVNARAIFPLRSKDRVVGAIILGNKESGTPFSQDEVELSSTLAAQAAIAIENAELYGSVIFDRSTSLYTIRYFTERLDEELSRADRYRRFLSVVILEIANLQDLIASHGRSGANLLQRQAAKVIKSVSRGSDLVARYKENDFAVILHETDDRSILHPLKRMRKVLIKYLSSAKDGIEVNVHLGVAIYPIHSTERKPLVEKAEAALARARDSEEGIYIYS